MATIKLDHSITSFMRKISGDGRFGDGTMSSIVENAIMFFAGKHVECFACKFHMDQVGGLELGRQKMSQDNYGSAKAPDGTDGEWVVISHDMLSKAKSLAAHYRRSTKHLAEQAIMEHLTRPPNCKSCPFYEKMCQEIRKEQME